MVLFAIQNNMKKVLLILLLSAVMAHVIAQNNILDGYIRQGLEENYALEQQKISYYKSLSEFREARGLYYPGLSMNARFTFAEGGRTISFPIRDIFDGYNLENNLANPEIDLVTPDAFSNEEINFLRKTEHETKLSLTQPLFNTDLFYNTRIRRVLTTAKKKSLESSSRKLVAEIREAYFNYLKTEELNAWLEEAKRLSTEFVRVNERLLQNDKITPDVVYRAKAQDAMTDGEIVEARRQRQVACTYFNYLIGQPSDSPVAINDSVNVLPEFDSYEEMLSDALKNREELDQLEILGEASDYNIRMKSSGILPSLTAAAEYGFQGERYRFTGDYDYALVSVVMRWNLFEGFQKKEQLKQALFDRQNLELEKQDAIKKIEIEVSDGWYGFKAAEAAIHTSVLEEQAMRKAFDIIKRKYENGQSGLLEYTDAHTQWSQSVMNRIIRKYDYYIAYFNLLRISASEDIAYYMNDLP